MASFSLDECTSWGSIFISDTRRHTLNDRLFFDPERPQFYDLANGWDVEPDYCVDLAKKSHLVLDLACGRESTAS